MQTVTSAVGFQHVQAVLLADKMGRHEEALPLVEEAYRLVTAHGLHALAEQTRPILDRVRSAQP